MFFFFFKQKTAYEIMPSLVGSEMCIRDRYQRRVHGAVMQEERRRFACPAIDVDARVFVDREMPTPLPPVAFVEFADAAGEQFFLVLVEMWVLDAVEHAPRLAGIHGLRIDEFHVALGVGVDQVGSGNGANLDLEDIGETQAVVVAQEHQLAIDLCEAPAIVHAAIRPPFLETEDGAVWRVIAENADVAGFVKMRDAALFIQPGIELFGGGQLDELARYDEDQLAARFQVADALLDEEQEEVAPCTLR
eukprot:TRINITY_DN2068_c0_g1_i3.p2 TRINITY_DN2068_c0_g1~~TRINITY_DN2068_c0_g1_i3.p2  ORF type:complete len:248 (-),score=40.98 TRINITY_DN2068_c0_g1_i3:2-745(-)